MDSPSGGGTGSSSNTEEGEGTSESGDDIITRSSSAGEQGLNRLQNAISDLRNGQSSHHLPVSTHQQPHPQTVQQSPPMQSLDIDFSQQQPGPSGLHLLSPPTQPMADVHLHSSNGSSSGGSGEQMVPGGNVDRNRSDFDPSLVERRKPPEGTRIPFLPMFEIPPSQDILAQSTTQDISVGFSQPVDSLSESLSAGPPLEILPVGFDQLAEEQRTREEERHRQEEEQRQDRAEFLRQQGRELQDYLNRPGEEQQDTPTEASGSYDTASSVEDPLIVNLRAEFAERQARWRRRRQQAGNRVPGTESSQSSDDGALASYQATVRRAVHKTISGVPSLPSQLTTCSQSARNQALTATPSSESEMSSSEIQALKGERIEKGDQVVIFISPHKVDKKPSQKVPKLSSKKFTELKASEKTTPTDTPQGTVSEAVLSQAAVSTMTIPTSEAQVTSAVNEQTSDSESQTEMETEMETGTETEQPAVAMELEVAGGAKQEQESEGAESGGHELPRSDKYDSEGPRGQSATSSHVDEGTLSLSEPELYVPGTELPSHSGNGSVSAGDHVKAGPSHVSCTPQTDAGPTPLPRDGPGPLPRANVTESSSEEDSSHTRPSITANPPSWGAETDASTEFPATQTTSSSATGSSSGSGSTSVNPSTDSSQQAQSVGSQTASSQFTDFDPQTQSQTIPISSTPYEDIESHVMQPPSDLISPLMKKPVKRSSDETTTSSTTTTSSGSAGHLEKIKSHKTGQSLGSVEMSGRVKPTADAEDVPLALESPTPPQTPSPGQRGCAYKGEVVPATPPGSEHTEPGDSKLVSTGKSTPADEKPHAKSRSYLSQDDSQDLGNQVPSWITDVLPPVNEEGEGSQPSSQVGSKRPLSRQDSSSSDQASLSPRPPPPKRKRARNSRSSSSEGNVPKWDRSNVSTDSNICPVIEQAQPTSIVSAERSRSISRSSSRSGSGVAKSPRPIEKQPAVCSQTSSQGLSLSGASGTSSSSTPHTSSSSGTSSSQSSGYPRSSSHSSSSPDGPSSGNRKCSPGDGSGGEQLQHSPTGRNETEFSSDGNDRTDSQSGSHENVDTKVSHVDVNVESSSLEETQGTQDSFLKGKSESLSSREGGESGYSAGSSSVSVLASASASKSMTSSSLSHLTTVTESQETVENSVSCVEDSAPLGLETPGDKMAFKTPTRMTQSHKDNAELSSGKTCGSDDVTTPTEISDEAKQTEAQEISIEISDIDDHTSRQPILVESQEDEVDGVIIVNEVSSELLPVVSPRSPELVEKNMDASSSPKVAGSSLHNSTFKTPTSDKERPREIDHVSLMKDDLISSQDMDMEQEEVMPMTESSQAMETDLISTQSSFVLQLADSQCSIAPVSPGRCTEGLETEDVREMDGAEGEGKDVKELEKDFPNQPETKQLKTVDSDINENSSPVRETRDEGTTTAVNVSQDGNHDTNKLTTSASAVNLSDGGLNTAAVDASNHSSRLPANKPAPVYESFACDDSSSQGLSVVEGMVLETNTRFDVQVKTATAADRGSQHSMDVSQSTNSSTQFQIPLPQSNLHPQFSMTPPTQKNKLSPPTNSSPCAAVEQQKPLPTATSRSSSSSDVPMVSPSELDTSVFKSPSPDEMTDNVSRKTKLDKSGATTVVSAEEALPPFTNTGAASSPCSEVDKEDSVCDPSGASEGRNELIRKAQEVRADKQEQENVTEIVGAKSPPPSTLKRQTSLTASSPKMCLSLKKCKLDTVMSKRLPNAEKSADSATAEFVIGVRNSEGDLNNSVDSQLPAIEVPNDSQFEVSADSQTLFQIQRPMTAEPVAQSPVSSSQKQAPDKSGQEDNAAASSLFAFVDPGLSSRLAIRKAKDVPIPSHNSPQRRQPSDKADPYQYDSQNDLSDASSSVQRRRKRSSRRTEHTVKQTAAKRRKQKDDESTRSCLTSVQPDRDKQPLTGRKPLDDTIPTQRKLGDEGTGQSVLQPPLQNNGSESGDNENDVQQNSEESLTSSQPLSDAERGSQPTHSNFSSPLLLPSVPAAVKMSPFSPSTVVPSSLVTELKRGAGVRQGDGYQLKVVKVVRTIVEERQIFSEVIRDGRVVPDSGRTWMERSAPNIQLGEELCLSPIIASLSANQSPPITVTLSFSTSHFCPPQYVASTFLTSITPSALATPTTVTTSLPAISSSPFASTTTTSTPLDPSVASVTTPQSRQPLQSAPDSCGSGIGLREPVVRILPFELERPGTSPLGPSSRTTPTLPSDSRNNKEIGVQNNSQNDEAMNEQSQPSALASEDTAPDKDDSDGVICLENSSAPVGRHLTRSSARLPNFDSSEDFQESPLPMTPRKSPRRRALPKTDKRQASVGRSTGKKAVHVSRKKASKERMPVTKTIVTRKNNMTSKQDHAASTSGDITPSRQSANHRETISRLEMNSCDKGATSVLKSPSSTDNNPPLSKQVSSPQSRPRRRHLRSKATVEDLVSAFTEMSSSDEATPSPVKAKGAGTKRSLENDEGLASSPPRKKLKSSESTSPVKDGGRSESTIRTRARDTVAVSPEASTSTVSTGSVVMARWGDRNWYPASVLSECKNGKFSIIYADGDSGTVPRCNMFPLDHLEVGVPVIITAKKALNESQSSGLFAGFNRDSAQQFFVEDGNHLKHSYDLNRLCLPQESANTCLVQHTGYPYCDVSRKRGRLTSPKQKEETAGPVSKKKKASCSPSQPSLTVERVSDVPSEQRTLFQGYTFMLTLKPKDDVKSSQSMPADTSVTDKAAVAQQVINRRGKVVESYNEDTLVFRRRFFVLSDTCCRTHKYLIGLALGVPCVKYSWIKDSIEKGKVLDYNAYILPAGHDQSKTVPWSLRDQVSIMDGIVIHVFASDEKFKDHWCAILRAANAKICHKLPSSNQISRSRCAAELCNTVVVSELRYVTKSLLHQVSNTGMKLVSTEWIVQSLIYGKARTDYAKFSLK